MEKYRQNWYYIGGIIFAILAFGLAFAGEFFDPRRKLMVIFYMSLLLHQFEEYAVPGGFPVSWNAGVSGEKVLIDRYPLNTKSAFIVNICCGYPIYILGIIFSDIYWVGIFIAYFTMAQSIVHGGVINKKIGAVYNPGIATALFIMLPAGCYYLWYLASHFSVPLWNWWAPLAAFPPIAFLTILFPVLKCQDRNTTFAFPQRDIKGFSVKNRIARIRR